MARPATEISIASIVNTLEGPIGITECCDLSDSNCELQVQCKVKPHLARINRSVRETLEGVKTIGDRGWLGPIRAAVQYRKGT